jgi:hypothetical protein
MLFHHKERTRIGDDVSEVLRKGFGPKPKDMGVKKVL